MKLSRTLPTLWRSNRRGQPKRKPERRRLEIERLEDRTLLSAASGTNQVLEFDAATGTQRVIPADPGLDALVEQLRVAGFQPGVAPGNSDGLDHVSLPEEFTGTKTIFGNDDRVRITPTTSYPWRAVGRLQTPCPSASGWCSGAMIGAYHFLTAGHCVNYKDYGGWATDLKVAQAQDDSKTRPYGVANWTYARTYTAWVNNKDF